MTPDKLEAAMIIVASIIVCGALSAILPPLVGKLLRKLGSDA